MNLIAPRCSFILTSMAFVIAMAAAGCAARKSSTPPTIHPAPVPEPLPVTVYEDPLPIPAELSISDRGREAIQVLGHAKAFGGHAVGYAGRPLAEVVALRALLAEPHSAEALIVVLDHGSLPGQLMALCGLYFADPTLFRERLDHYRTITTLVPRAREGCFGQPPPPEPANEIVETDGGMRFQGPHDTLADWIKRNRVQLPAVALKYDIAGGGYPHTFFGRK